MKKILPRPFAQQRLLPKDKVPLNHLAERDFVELGAAGPTAALQRPFYSTTGCSQGSCRAPQGVSHHVY